jgi:hypothetical protein
MKGMDAHRTAEMLGMYFTSGAGADLPEADQCRSIAGDWAELTRATKNPEPTRVRDLVARASVITAAGTGAEELRVLIPLWARGST